MLACIPCGNKKFATQNAYANHVQSKKHKIAEAKYDEKADREANAARAAEASAAADGGDGAMDTGGMQTAPAAAAAAADFDDGASVMSGMTAMTGMTGMTERTYPEPEVMELELEDCIFCRHRAATLEDSLKHMVHAHGFFIPDLKCV